jgi:hypothetical protein
MMPTIFTGPGGVTYQGFAPPMYGAWNQGLLGAPPYHYLIGGTTYKIRPRPPGTQHYFPYMGPSVPFHAGRFARFL